jgi:hypothetical protein
MCLFINCIQHGWSTHLIYMFTTKCRSAWFCKNDLILTINKLQGGRIVFIACSLWKQILHVINRVVLFNFACAWIFLHSLKLLFPGNVYPNLISLLCLLIHYINFIIMHGIINFALLLRVSIHFLLHLFYFDTLITAAKVCCEF